MQPRRFARELALLGSSQLNSTKPSDIANQDLDALVTSAVRSLAGEVQDALEVAAGEVQQGQDQLLASETRASSLEEARALVQKALEKTQAAINRVGSALQIPEMIQLSNRKEIRSYAIELMLVTGKNRDEVDAELNEAMVSWNVKRLPKIDRDILRIAVVEMKYLGVPDRVVINEAVEIAKRYSDEDGYRFINGVLRRWVNRFLKPGEAIAEADSTIEAPPSPVKADSDAPLV
ncbi:transcription antitermination factor NusB [Leptolyngbya iicbica]|uniref:Transcription antitermination protein NusB n=2 Tax=Cyanophyceae TaxID=3028117 RepID=A0A4Q7E393_9CYAN|nr:transcription antitermination factor NusB [Leptolyngbya sp. LK]RZM76093.1 transcription antitermination protein NusB [Leptolyngbya sp. LK]